MSVDKLAQNIAAEFRKDPRNKVFVAEDGLLASATEETGSQISKEKLRAVIAHSADDNVDEEALAIYDGALYIVHEVARLCFGEDPDDEEEEVNYVTEWVIDFSSENHEGYAVEIRPC